MKIEVLTTCSEEFMAALQNLMPQLTRYSPIPDESAIEDIINHTGTTIWLIRNPQDNICGMLTLAIYPSPTGLHGWIEDVVINAADRNQGYASALTKAALLYAQNKNVKAVSLTSRPARTAANQLYQKLGFKQIETNLYRFSFS